MVTLVECKSAIHLAKSVFSDDIDEVADTIISMLSGYKDICHTIAFGGSREFIRHKEVAETREVETHSPIPYGNPGYTRTSIGR